MNTCYSFLFQILYYVTYISQCTSKMVLTLKGFKGEELLCMLHNVPIAFACISRLSRCIMMQLYTLSSDVIKSCRHKNGDVMRCQNFH